VDELSVDEHSALGDVPLGIVDFRVHARDLRRERT
jgi:hypothetical protein